jgi:beta-galactosidase
LVIAPGLNVISAALAKHLQAFVEGGGHLVLGPRSGLKDEWNALNVERQPGPLVPLLGGRVEQFYALDQEVPVTGQWGSGVAKIWAEQLGSLTPGAETVLSYGASNGWLDNQPAVITRSAGNGRITYVGAWLDDSLMRQAAGWMLKVSGIEPLLATVPDGVEVDRRTGAGKAVFILVNHSKESKQIALPRVMQSVLSGESVSSVTLEPRGVAVLLNR